MSHRNSFVAGGLDYVVPGNHAHTRSCLDRAVHHSCLRPAFQRLAQRQLLLPPRPARHQRRKRHIRYAHQRRDHHLQRRGGRRQQPGQHHGQRVCRWQLWRHHGRGPLLRRAAQMEALQSRILRRDVLQERRAHRLRRSDVAREENVPEPEISRLSSTK